MEERQRILNSVIDIIENNNKIEIKNIKLDFSVSKYSSTKNSIWHIILNNNILSKKNTYIFKYGCITCKSIQQTNTIQFLRKINKGSKCCYLCRNKNEEKREKHSILMKGNNNPMKNESNKVDKIKVINTPIQLKNDSLILFNSYDNNFKEEYFNFHLTHEDYIRIYPNIISLQPDNYNKISEYEFWPIYKSNNQMEFTSVMYDKNTDTIFKVDRPIMKCEKCKLQWRAKSLEKFKNNIKIYCKDCSFVSNTFKLRIILNCNKEEILYQSKLELKFIDWCNLNNIIIKNGPKIQYNFRNKDRIYKVDFQIKNTLIEIKDFHIWHKKDLESGKWKSKEDAVYKLIELGKYENYYLITPNNWNEHLEKINKI